MAPPALRRGSWFLFSCQLTVSWPFCYVPAHEGNHQDLRDKLYRLPKHWQHPTKSFASGSSKKFETCFLSKFPQSLVLSVGSVGMQPPLASLVAAWNFYEWQMCFCSLGVLFDASSLLCSNTAAAKTDHIWAVCNKFEADFDNVM